MSGFRDVTGHERTIEHLKNAIASGRVSQAYLLVGDKGMGKKTIAQAFAQTLQCETLERMLEQEQKSPGEKNSGTLPLQSIDACGTCKSCRQAETNNQPDIMVWRYQKETSISVDDIRSLVSDVQIKPYASRYKIYILPDAQKMTREAQNALLKTLEEPPEYAVIILLSTSRDAMLETILSRCVVLPLRPVDAAKVRSYLMDRHGVEPYKAAICVAFAQGNIGKAAMLANSEYFNEIIEEVIHLLRNIKEMQVEELVEAVKKSMTYKMEIGDYLDMIAIWYRDVLIYKATKNVDKVIFADQIKYIKEQASKSSYEGIENILDALEKAKARLKANVNFELTMDLLLLAIKGN